VAQVVHQQTSAHQVQADRQSALSARLQAAVETAGLAYLDRLISAVAVAVVLARIQATVLSVATVDLAARMALLVLQALSAADRAEAIRLLPERMANLVRLLVAELVEQLSVLTLEERELPEQTDR